MRLPTHTEFIAATIGALVVAVVTVGNGDRGDESSSAPRPAPLARAAIDVTPGVAVGRADVRTAIVDAGSREDAAPASGTCSCCADIRRRESVDRVRSLMELTRHVAENADPRAPLEGQATEIASYLGGWAEAALRSPEDRRHVATEVGNRLCGADVTPLETLVLLGVARLAPEREVAEGLTCVLVRAEAEDVILWAAIDAWSTAHLPEAAAIVRWRRDARDERTLRRLSPMRVTRGP